MPCFLPSDTPHKRIFRFAFYGILTVLFAQQSLAQETIPTIQADTTKSVKVIEAVPTANIGSETESTLSEIRSFRNSVRPTKSELLIEDQMPAKLEVVLGLRKSVNLDNIKSMNLRQTESIKNDFSQLKMQLEGWRNSLMEVSEEVSEVGKELNKLKVKWEKTLLLDRDEELPPVVVERIGTNLDEIKSLDESLKTRNNELLTKLDALTEGLIFVNDVLDALTRTERSQRSNIFVLSSPLIWNGYSAENDTTGTIKRMENLYHKHNSTFKNFRINYRENIYYHFFFFVILLILSFYLKREVAQWPDKKKDDAIRQSLQIISKPISASLLITLLLSGLFYPDVSPDVLNYYYILLVVPILTTIPGLFPGIKKKFFYAAGAIFVFTQLLEYFLDLIFLSRIVLLILNIATIILLWYLQKDRHNTRKKSPGVRWGFVFFIVYLNMALLAIAVLANCVGNTILSHILSRGALTVIYGGVLAYACSAVLRGIVSLLIQDNGISKLNVIQNYSEEVKQKSYQIISWGLRIYWLYLSLSGFLLWDSLYDWANSALTNQWQLGTLDISIGSILLFFITIWISLLISRFIRFILQEEILLHFELPRGVPGAISMLVRLSLITVGFILALGAANIPFDNVAIIFGALGVGIGFGLQNIFNNLVSGLILAFERPIQIGDVIQISTLDLMGEVKEIGIRASIVRTFDGAEVVVPNGNLISNEMVNWTLSDHRRRQELIVGVAYGTEISKVMEILNEIVANQEFVLKVPNPSVLFMGFGDSSLDFRVLFWTHFDHGIGTKSAVGVAINEAFNKADIEIPFPQRDLHLRSGFENVSSPDQKKAKSSSEPEKKSVAKLEQPAQPKVAPPAKKKP